MFGDCHKPPFTGFRKEAIPFLITQGQMPAEVLSPFTSNRGFQVVHLPPRFSQTSVFSLPTFHETTETQLDAVEPAALRKLIQDTCLVADPKRRGTMLDVRHAPRRLARMRGWISHLTCMARRVF